MKVEQKNIIQRGSQSSIYASNEVTKVYIGKGK